MQFAPYIEALKEKNQEAFEAIYHETKHAVYAMVLPIVKDRFSAEDVMQETYIKMVEKIHSYHTKRPFMPWLLTIAKHTALDFIRRRRDIAVDPTENEDLFVSKATHIEQKMESEYYLSLLTDTERQIVLLKVVANVTHADIAKLLGMPPGTIRYLYKKAMDQMREAAKGESA